MATARAAIDKASRVKAVELDVGGGHYPELDEVLAYWHDRRGEFFAPRRADIDPVDLRMALSRITLSDVFYDPLDFRYRLCGTQVCTAQISDTTGYAPRDLLPVAYGQLLYDHYCEAVRRRTPMLHLISVETDDQMRAYARLLLPLSEDRERVTMLMTVDSKDQNSQALRAFFARAVSGDI